MAAQDPSSLSTSSDIAHHTKSEVSDLLNVDHNDQGERADTTRQQHQDANPVDEWPEDEEAGSSDEESDNEDASDSDSESSIAVLRPISFQPPRWHDFEDSSCVQTAPPPSPCFSSTERSTFIFHVLLKDAEESECPICHKEYGVRRLDIENDMPSQLPCGHEFGEKCLKWFSEKKTCPTCRGDPRDDYSERKNNDEGDGAREMHGNRGE
jgi:hypothetical protein